MNGLKIMDIDIDVSTQINPSDIFENIIPASIVENGELKKHNVGYYFQNMPVDNITGLSAIPYKKALDFDYFKIDIIHLKLLDYFNSKKELLDYTHKEPKWEMLWDKKVVPKLFHLSKSYDLLNKIRPKSVLEIADCLALIRPGKQKLINSYIKDKNAIRPELYNKTRNSDLRKSHALPYAYLIIAQLNLIRDKKYET